MAAEEGIPFINLTESFADLPASHVTHYFDGGHPNEFGYSFIAEQILLQLRGILPTLPCRSPETSVD
jgi:lysophospholipase L1-like esterase